MSPPWLPHVKRWLSGVVALDPTRFPDSRQSGHPHRVQRADGPRPGPAGRLRRKDTACSATCQSRDRSLYAAAALPAVGAAALVLWRLETSDSTECFRSAVDLAEDSSIALEGCSEDTATAVQDNLAEPESAETADEPSPLEARRRSSCGWRSSRRPRGSQRSRPSDPSRQSANSARGKARPRWRPPLAAGVDRRPSPGHRRRGQLALRLGGRRISTSRTTRLTPQRLLSAAIQSGA